MQQAIQAAANACIMQPDAGQVPGLKAIHNLTKLLVQATSAQIAAAWAELAIQVKPCTEQPTESHAKAPGGTTSPLVTTLLAHCTSGEQHMLVALDCLTLLAISPKVCQQMIHGGLVPVLVAVLLGGATTLEPALQLTALKLVACLVAVDGCCLMQGMHAQPLLSVIQHGLSSPHSAHRAMCCDLLYQVLQYLQASRPASPQIVTTVQTLLDQAMNKEQPPQTLKRLRHCQQLALLLAAAR